MEKLRYIVANQTEKSWCEWLCSHFIIFNENYEFLVSDHINCFPDDGAREQFHEQLQPFPTVLLLHIVNLKVFQCKYRHYIYMDDLTNSTRRKLTINWNNNFTCNECIPSYNDSPNWSQFMMDDKKVKY